MKKIKHLLPIICSTCALAGSVPIITSCTFFNHSEEKTLVFTGGDTYLLGGMEKGVPVATKAYKSWDVTIDGEPVSPTNVEMVMLDTSSPADIHLSVVENRCYINWGKEVKPGLHKFMLVASYKDSESKITYQATTPAITLEITSNEKLVLLDAPTPYLFSPTPNRQPEWKISVPEIAFVNGNYQNLEVTAKITTKTQEIKTFKSGDCFWAGTNKVLFDIFFNMEDDYRSLTPGIYDISLYVSDEETGATLLNDEPIHVEAGFQTDSWENVIHYSKQGLKSLQQHYGIDDFTGLYRGLYVNGALHKVRVVGQEEDLNDKGKPITLTFEFYNAISTGNTSQYYESGAPLVFPWEIDESKTNFSYIDSTIPEALNNDTFTDWYISQKSDIIETDINSGVLKMMDIEVAAALQPIRRKYFSTKPDGSIEWTTRAYKLTQPCLHNYYSLFGIVNSEDLSETEKYCCLQETNHQYSVYRKYWGDHIYKDREWGNDWEIFNRYSIWEGGFAAPMISTSWFDDQNTRKCWGVMTSFTSSTTFSRFYKYKDYGYVGVAPIFGI
ncbi:MAG: hypothetical protein ACOQNY_00255 [Mycoplasmoidaceae bacterium]